MLRGATTTLSLPAYAIHATPCPDTDAGFADRFWDAVDTVRGTGAPRRIEQHSFRQGNESFFEIWLAPTLTNAVVGIVPSVTGTSYATSTVRDGEEATPRAISDLWKEKHRLQGERDRLARLATRDCLTGLWNRRAIFERLSETLGGALRDNLPVSVIMADIDGFKNINDRFGHDIGDAVLRETARRCCFCVRRSDELGRYGGEEFLIVLPGCGTQAAMTRVEEFRAAIGGNPSPSWVDN